MSRWYLILVLLIPALVVRADEPPRQIRLVSEVWRDYTNADGSGMAWDVLRQVFEPAGIALHLQSMPYTRSVGLVQRGEADAWVGSFRDEVKEKVIYPRQSYDSDAIVALGLADKPVPSLETLGDYRLVWMHGYGFDRYLPNVRNFREVQRRIGIIGMLEQGHADLFIDSLSEAEDVLDEAPVRERLRLTELTRLPLYLGFADTPRGRHFARIYDQRMSELLASGELRPIFKRWQQAYPF